MIAHSGQHARDDDGVDHPMLEHLRLIHREAERE
jgi:hypothetical protein